MFTADIHHSVVHRTRPQIDRQALTVFFSIFFSLGDSNISRGDPYPQQQQQARGAQQGYGTYGTGAAAAQDIGQQASDTWGQGGTGMGTTGTQYDTSGQYGGSTTGRGEGGAAQDDDDDSYPTGSGGGGGKPSMTSKVQGTCWWCCGVMLPQADVKGGGVLFLSQAPVRGWRENLQGTRGCKPEVANARYFIQYDI